MIHRTELHEVIGDLFSQFGWAFDGNPDSANTLFAISQIVDRSKEMNAQISDLTAHFSRIGAEGGKKSRRKLTPEQAKALAAKRWKKSL